MAKGAQRAGKRSSRIRLAGNSDDPLYQQVKDYIEKQVSSGHWPRGYRFPTLRQMSADLKIACATVARGVRELVSSGLLEARSGRGTALPGYSVHFVKLSSGRMRLEQIAEVAAEFQVPILFHDGTPPVSLTSQVALLSQRHPGTKIILGHSGLFEHFREAAAAVNACDNLWACLCGPHVQGLRHLLAHVPAERLLWGTELRLRPPGCLHLSRRPDRPAWPERRPATSDVPGQPASPLRLERQA
jgi:DNA-binding transcriptional regulator YhcF (GntR family)